MMKRKILWWALMLLLLVSLVWLAGNNQGYVLIVRTPYRVQISFNFLLILFVLGFFALHYCLRALHFVRNIPANKRGKQQVLRLKAANAALLEGMQALMDGDEKKAGVAAKLAHDLIQHPDLETLMQKLAANKTTNS
ncbi:MAG: heme biosynthesis protein HemY [Methylotenera sp.]|nr:heme biosynthesis protein HemY [Methylotenera sp.]